MTTPHPEYIDVHAAAKIVGCTPGTIRRRIEDGTLTAYRLGPRAIRIKRDDLDMLFSRVEVSA